MEENISGLRVAFRNWSGEECLRVHPLPASGSERTYWRLTGSTQTAIGAFHPVREENASFLAMSSHFRRYRLNVPEIHYHDLDRGIYLMQDLGDTSLFSLIDLDAENPYNEQLTGYFEKALSELVRFQVIAGRDLDYSLCYPRQAFDRQSIAWDLYYFKYYFLKLVTVFNEQKLEDDFHRLSDYLLQALAGYFMYRDFQSRNIMIHENTLYFIDYQGGRKGPLQYDPISLLYQVRAQMPARLRSSLLKHYHLCLQDLTGTEWKDFMSFTDGFILLRLLQVLGAYGYRGLIQKKSHFLESLPYAINQLNEYLNHNTLPVDLPELMSSLSIAASSNRFRNLEGLDKQVLTVEVKSFSFKKGYPDDFSGHGGGFVFDCRALPNPGREEALRNYTGRDPIIVQYLEAHSEVADFLSHAFEIAQQAIENYRSRGFLHLSLSFGCTGGQHRSVYCAEKLAAQLHLRFPDIRIHLAHRELTH